MRQRCRQGDHATMHVGHLFMRAPSRLPPAAHSADQSLKAWPRWCMVSGTHTQARMTVQHAQPKVHACTPTHTTLALCWHQSMCACVCVRVRVCVPVCVFVCGCPCVCHCTGTSQCVHMHMPLCVSLH